MSNSKNTIESDGLSQASFSWIKIFNLTSFIIVIMH